VVDVQALTEGYLVVSDAWYPGWSATLERLDSPGEAYQEAVQQADILFRAVPIQPGLWRVRLSYESSGVAFGGVVTGIGLVTLCLYAWVAGRFRSKV